jgi:hypothetical protein
MPPEKYTVTLGGINGQGAKIAAYDPLANTDVPVTVSGAAKDKLTVVLTATDTPVLLIVQEA